MLEILFASSPASHRFGGQIEILDALRRLELVKREWKGHAAVDLLALLPQALGETDIGEGNGFHGIIGGRQP